MKATSSVSYIDFQKKKNVTEQFIYNSWYDKWLDIKRACDPSKTIVHEAIAFVAAIEFLFTKNPDEIIFNKELLKKKCKQGARQRCRFLAQLADLYKITPRTSYDYKGKKYHYVYSVKRTKNSLEILQNPKEFYKKNVIKLVTNPDKNVLETSQKCLHTKTNLSASIPFNPLEQQEYGGHRNTIETYKNKDLSDLCSSEDISLGTESQDLKNQDTHFVSSSQTELEANTEFPIMNRVDRMIAREQARRERDALEGNSFEEVLARAKAERDKERLALAKQHETARTEPPKVVPDQEPQKPDPNSELLEVARLELAQAQTESNDTHVKNGNVYHGNKLLNEFEFTDELIDAVIDKSDKPHFSRERVRVIMRNIVASNPNLRIWGGKNAFINYMVKAVNNEKEFTKEEKAQSLAEMKRKEAEQVMYDFQHRVIRYF